MNKPFNFSSAREQAEKEYGLGKGEYLKLKNGNNTFRLLSECIPYESTYNGKKNFKWVCWVLDRADKVVKPFFMPHSIYKTIEDYQFNPEYAFEEVPMPYDITIHAKNAGTIDAEYTVTPARQNTLLTAEELAEFEKRIDITEFVQKLREKAGQPEVSAAQRAHNHAEVEAALSEEDPFEGLSETPFDNVKPASDLRRAVAKTSGAKFAQPQ
ncbi:MAG TPA: hypothetical protein VFD58_05730 [Blastocatellia bacterium]|nr:hypothetical protein [Blastocatellia bacterium]